MTTGQTQPSTANAATRQRGSAVPRKRDARQMTLADWLVDLVELRFDLARGSVRHGTRRSMRMVEARHLAAYLLHTELGLSQAATARVLGRHRTTVVNSLQRVEDSRDDPVLNRHIENLTGQLDSLRDITR